MPASSARLYYRRDAWARGCLVRPLQCTAVVGRALARHVLERREADQTSLRQGHAEREHGGRSREEAKVACRWPAPAAGPAAFGISASSMSCDILPAMAGRLNSSLPRQPLSLAQQSSSPRADLGTNWSAGPAPMRQTESASTSNGPRPRSLIQLPRLHLSVWLCHPTPLRTAQKCAAANSGLRR